MDATEFMEKHAWEALRQTVSVKARNHAGVALMPSLPPLPDTPYAHSFDWLVPTPDRECEKGSASLF